MENTYISTTDRGLTKEIQIPVPWGHVSAKTWGNTSSKPVLCIHGWMDNCNSFDTLIPLLPQDNYYVCFDLPGCGKSSFFPPGMFYNFVDDAALIHRISKYFKWDKFSILGHSLGGNIGGLFSGIFPEKVDKLVLIEAPGIYQVPVEKAGETVQNAVVGMYELENRKIEKPIGLTFESAKARLLKANKALSNDAADILLQRGTYRLENGLYEFSRDKRHRIFAVGPITFEMARTVVRNVKADVLMAIGKDGDSNIEIIRRNFELVFERVKDMKNYQIIWVEGKHFLHLCHPEIIAQQISTHLNQPSRFMSRSTLSKL